MVLLTAALVNVAVLRPRHRGLSDLLSGVLLAAVALTKVIVGIMLLLPLTFVGVAAAPGTSGRWWRRTVAIGTVLVAVPCPRGRRYAGRSRMGPEKLLTHGIRMLMPFAVGIAIRSLALCAITSLLIVVGSAGLLVARASGFLDAFPTWWGWALAAGVAVSALGFVNFLVLFAGHSQANALALARVEDEVTVE